MVRATVRRGGGIVELRESANCARELWVCALPRPGIEPGLEVPETSVMSFSLPGRKVCSRKHYISRIRDTGMIYLPVADTNSAGLASRCALSSF
jgi:hypothetical protein